MAYNVFIFIGNFVYFKQNNIQKLTTDLTIKVLNIDTYRS